MCLRTGLNGYVKMAGIGRTMNGKQQTEEGDEEIDLFRERIREAAGETFS